MKLIMAIVQDDDAQRVISNLMSEGFSVTKLSTTGGFLRVGNTTLILGVNDDRVSDVVSIVEHTCRSRKQIATTPSPVAGSTGAYVPYPVEVMVGGATIFVLPIEQFKKI
nr:cyclic-di-AMP receptor [bacterium]